MGMLLMFTLPLKTSAQNYLISFTATGAATTLDSVKAENITQATSLTVIGDDTLHLIGTAGINDLSIDEERIKIYPNPMQRQSELSFYAKKTGNARLIIYNISGKEVLQTNNVFLQGTQMCRITGLKQGVYFVHIIGENYTYSSKIISLSTAQSEAKIEFIGIEKHEVSTHQSQRAKSIISMPYVTGDNMRFTGYAGSLADIVNDVPTVSKTINFTFVAILPTITTTALSAITDTTATSGGNIAFDGGASVTARGVCWSTTTNPITTGNHTTNGTGTGTFILSLFYNL